MKCFKCGAEIPPELSGPVIIRCPECGLTGIPAHSDASIDGTSATSGSWMGIARPKPPKLPKEDE